MKKIKIEVEDLSVLAELNDTPTAQRVFEMLPIEASASVWGEEIYFDIPLTTGLEPDAREDVAVGDLGYWPTGPAFCIFFGPTPVSTADTPRAYSPVNVFGKVLGDAKQFTSVSSGAQIRISLLEEV